MRRLVGVVVAASVLAGAASGVEVKYGAKAGLNFSSYDGTIEKNGFGDRKTGITVGGVVNIGFSELLSLDTGLLYETKGSQGVHYDTKLDAEVSSSYLVIPALARFSLAGGKAYASAGITLGLLQEAEYTEGSATLDLTDRAEDTELSIVVGGGGAFPVGPGTLSVGGEYSLGITDMMAHADQSAKNRMISVMVGYTF